MDSPGFDPVSATGQVASGANVICFTTGRGSVFGCKPTPSLKIASNTSLYNRMSDDMDINCGTIIDGEETMEAGRPKNLRRAPRHGLRQTHPQRGPRLRRRRIPTLAPGRNPLNPYLYLHFFTTLWGFFFLVCHFSAKRENLLLHLQLFLDIITHFLFCCRYFFSVSPRRREACAFPQKGLA